MQINTNTTEVITTLFLSILFLCISIFIALRPFKVLNLLAKVELFKYRLMGLGINDIKYIKNPLDKIPSQKIFRDFILDPDPDQEDYQRIITIIRILGYSMSAIISIPLIITIGIILFKYL